MKEYNCDCMRCGTSVPHKELFYLTIRFPDYSETWSILCEQCYQTIKEVLEDGEIK